MSAYTYTLGTGVKNSIISEQVSHSPGTRYNPPQQALLTNGQTVWIAGQNGDGTNVYYQLSNGRWIRSADIEMFL